MRLVLSRLQPSDLDTTVPLQFAAFAPDGGFTAMMGPANPHNIARARSIFDHELPSNPANLWLKIVDADADDRIVCASNWKIYPTFVEADQEARLRDMAETAMKGADAVTWFDAQAEKTEAAQFTWEFMRRRHTYMREAHILLNILFTDRQYHRCGAGRMMVEWGNALADQLLLPCWVEGSQEGHHLYASCGYEDVEKVYVQNKHLALPLNYTVMRRPPKVKAMEGKDLKVVLA